MNVTDMSDSSLLEEAFSRLFVAEIVNDTLPFPENSCYNVNVIKDLRSVSDHCVFSQQMDDDGCFEDDNNNSIQISFSESIVGGNRLLPRTLSEPKRRKSVTFADSQGGDLVEVREYDNTVEPLQNGLSCNPRRHQSCKNEEIASPKYTLLFPQPCVNYSNFTRKLSTQKVCLENAQIISADVLIGTVKVQNLSYEKSVTVRLTTDGWRTFIDLDAKFLHSDSLDIDVFTFRINIEHGVRSVKFCIRFRCNDQEYWDNNDGLNYCVTAR